MTMLVTSIIADRAEAMRAAAEQALRQGADVVELRLDTLQEPNSAAGIANGLPTGRWMVTCRPADQGGRFHGSVEQRLPILLSSGPVGEGFIDFEYDAWKSSPLARSEIVSKWRPAGTPEAGPSLILSHHDLVESPRDIHALANDIGAVSECTAVKMAWPARDILSNLDAFALMQYAPNGITAICTGEAGLLSRVLAKKFNASASYCAASGDALAAPGQLTLDAMYNLYRWDAIDEATQLFGVIGHPLAHSLSPHLFNDAFARGRVNGVYLPLLIEPGYDNLAAFLDAVLEHSWLDAAGFSVTLPHKENALRYLGDRVDPPADRIGAVNTLRIEDGEIWGCNTDASAALETLLAGMNCDDEGLNGLEIDVLGAGGVGRALVAGLCECQASVTIYNRSPDRARALAEEFGCDARPWEDRATAKGKAIVNCTPLGMWPDVDASPMPAESLREGVFVFDAVYRPRRTRLLREVEIAGAIPIDGVGMFVRQAAMQFEYWTQQVADEAAMGKRLERATANQ